MKEEVSIKIQTILLHGINHYQLNNLVEKMDYGNSEQRKSKKQMRKKREFRVYKKGGRFRTSNVSLSPNSKSRNP